MGCLVLGGSLTVGIICIFASMGYAVSEQYALAGILFVLGFVVIAVGSVLSRKKLVKGETQFFEDNADASIIRVMHRSSKEVVYLSTTDDKMLGANENATSMSYFYPTYGVKSGTLTLNAEFYNKRKIVKGTVKETLTLDIQPKKYYELKFNKKDNKFVFYEAQLPSELKNYGKYIGN